ncbi:MAG: ArdC family protein [Erysipelotrichaceae bacterium]|nr:ArdC family protein [Erysipelotrichaceae bacterium]
MNNNKTKTNEYINDERNELIPPQDEWSNLEQVSGTNVIEYKGIDGFHLNLIAMEHGYNDNHWFTTNQINAMSQSNNHIHIKDSEAGHSIEMRYYSIIKNNRSDDEYYQLLAAANKAINKSSIVSSQNLFTNQQKNNVIDTLNLSNQDFEVNLINNVIYNGNQIEGLESLLSYDNNSDKIEFSTIENINLDNTVYANLLFTCNYDNIEVYLGIEINDNLDWHYTLYNHDGNIIVDGINDDNALSDVVDNVSDKYNLSNSDLCREDISKGLINYSKNNLKVLEKHPKDNILYINNNDLASYRLLNSKSVYDCDDKEELRHIKENDNIINQLYKKCGNCEYEVKAIGRDIDNDGYEKDFGANLCYDDVFDIVECYDFKNGVDFLIDQNKNLVIRCHGQGYIKNGKESHKVIDIVISARDEDKLKVDFNKVFDKAKKQIQSISKSMKL